jgi:hypothetical protein
MLRPHSRSKLTKQIRHNFVSVFLTNQTDKSEEQTLKHDISRLSKAALKLNSPSTFVQYSKVKREIDAKVKRIEAIQAHRKQSRIVTYSQSACFFLKYCLPLAPILLWWNTPVFAFPIGNAEPVIVGVVWWTIICNAVANRLAAFLS